jgi:hypothetical protein
MDMSSPTKPRPHDRSGPTYGSQDRLVEFGGIPAQNTYSGSYVSIPWIPVRLKNGTNEHEGRTR